MNNNCRVSATSLEPQQVIELYRSVGWGDKYSESKVKTMLDSTPIFYSAWTHDAAIGFLRAFSDNSYCTYLVEIIIHPDYQKQGYGKKLVDRLIDDYGHTPLYLNALRGQDKFFESCGIKTAKHLTAMSKKSIST